MTDEEVKELLGIDALKVKQVIIIRKDLKMRRGKEIAQGAHASIAWLTNRIAGRDRHYDPMDQRRVWKEFTEAEKSWVEGNFRKICVVVHSEEELLDIFNEARMAGLVAELIEDGGLTEFHGQLTYTAAAIGPDYDEKIDPVTGHLELY